MAGSRFVVLGMAPARSAWFKALAQWANSGSIPVEFVKCLSVVELRAHLASARRFSALVVDSSLSGLDRDLVDDARRNACPVIVVDDGRMGRDWRAIGATDVLGVGFERRDLVEVLSLHTSMITRGDSVPGLVREVPDGAGWRARLAMVCGPGGTGTSTAAIALAQGLGDDIRLAGMVLLADLALHAEQAMLHDAPDVVPGVQELVEAHRSGTPPAREVRDLTFAVEARNYHLLLGLLRAKSWTSIRPRAFEAALDSLRRAWRVVVCDTDSDLEGEAQSGSADVEERHFMARTVARQADAVFAVGQPGMKGAHSLVRVVTDLVDHGTPPGRIVPVVNRAPRSPRARAELTAAVAGLLRGGPGEAVSSPVFLPERRVDEAVRDGVRLPAALSAPLVGAFTAVTAPPATRAGPGPEPDLVTPGTIGSWSRT